MSTVLRSDELAEAAGVNLQTLRYCERRDTRAWHAERADI